MRRAPQLRREHLGQVFFQTATHLESKLKEPQCHDDEQRRLSSRDGEMPVESGDDYVFDINACRPLPAVSGMLQPR